MSLANPTIVKIDGTDYGPAGLAAVAGMNGDCTGIDRIGVAHIMVRFPAASGYVFVPTREVQIYIETYTGSTHTGNDPLFGGFIKAEGITVYNVPSGETVVDLQCQDYNCLLDAIIPDLDVGSGGHFTIGADTFENQVASMVLQFQENNHGAVAKAIEATHDVQPICGGHVFPNLIVQTGLSLREGLRILMQQAVAFDAALRPRFFLELVDDVGTPANVICGLVVYDAAAGLPSASITFAESPGVGEHQILGTVGHKRTFDASMPLANYVQNAWHPGGGSAVKVKTSEGSSSEAIYYNPYINGRLTGNKGPWKLPIIKDTNSATDAEAQLVADLARYSKEYPRETLAISEDGVHVQPRSTVHIRTTNIDQDYEVGAVQFAFPTLAKPTYVRYTLSCGLPLLELFDQSGQDWTQAPQIFGVVHPELQNPSFEHVGLNNAPLNWTVTNTNNGVGVVDTTTAADGQNSFHFYTPAPTDEVLLTSDIFALRYLDGGDAGALVYLDLKMKRGSHNVNSIDIYVDWYDQSLTLVDTETVVSGLNLLTTWSSYHYDLPWPGSSPENVTAARLRFHSQPMSGAYDWWIDSLQVEQEITAQRMVATTQVYGLHLPFDSGGGPLAPFSLPAVRIPVASQITGSHLLTQHGETMTASVGIWVNATQWPTVADLVTTLSMSATDHYDNTGLSIAVTAGSWLIANLASVSGSSVTQLSAALDMKKT